MTGTFRFEPCPNCCVTGCVYESDNFDRDNNTDLGAKWTETAGDWSISTNRLAIAAASAKVTCATLAPAGSLKYLASVSITLGTDGDVARVFVDDSAFFAELERITSTCGRLRLYDGATCKGSVGVALGGYTRLVLCVEAAKIHVGTGGSPMLTVPATPASSIVALGTGACTGTVYFEDFSLSKHADDDATCPACGSEGCTWFRDDGCASGSLSATDYTVTGTWAYSYYYGAQGPTCSADGTLTIMPTHPLPSQKTVFNVQFARNGPAANFSVGATVTISLGGGATVVCTLVTPASGYRWSVQLFKSGIQYGLTVTQVPAPIKLCWDGTYLTVNVPTPGVFGQTTCVGKVGDTIASLLPTITVANLGAGNAIPFAPAGTSGGLTLTKYPDDIAGCVSCTPPDCVTCAPGTFTNTARVVIANLTSVDYGCACTDVTINLTATTSGCSWTGTASGPCSSGTWTATATVSAVTGGYKLSVSVSNTTGVSALFEETVLGGLPDCSAAFDGDIPWVSASGTLHCTMGSATCTFTSPAP